MRASEEQHEVSKTLRQFEHDTGIQAVAAVIGKADDYPELPWKAYALGSAIGALSVVVVPFLVTDWSVAFTIAVQAMAILGTGAALAALAVLLPPVARLFLGRLRAEAEVRQYGTAMFVEREIFATPERRAVLVVVSRFERVAAVIPDSGVAAYATDADFERVARDMGAVLIRSGVTPAFESGFAALRKLLAAGGYVPATPRPNELSDAVVVEKGP